MNLDVVHSFTEIKQLFDDLIYWDALVCNHLQQKECVYLHDEVVSLWDGLFSIQHQDSLKHTRDNVRTLEEIWGKTVLL